MLPASPERKLFVLENLPPMSSSSPKENTRRCRDHFFFGLAFSSSGDAGLCRLLRLRARKNSRPKIASMPSTTGTAMAACRPELHEMLSHFCDTATEESDWLDAAFVAVLEGEFVGVPDVGETSDCDDSVDVERVDGMDEVCDVVATVDVLLSLVTLLIDDADDSRLLDEVAVSTSEVCEGTVAAGCVGVASSGSF